MILSGYVSYRDFVNDLRAGLSDAELMEKYRLSRDGLKSLAVKLLELRDPVDLETAAGTLMYMDSSGTWHRRREPRYCCRVLIPVYDESYWEVGQLGDVTLHGLRVDGIDAEVGQVRALTIGAEQIRGISPIELEAKCKWSQPIGDTGDSVAGFEILRLSSSARDELVKLIRAVSLS